MCAAADVGSVLNLECEQSAFTNVPPQAHAGDGTTGEERRFLAPSFPIHFVPVRFLGVFFYMSLAATEVFRFFTR